MRKQYPIAREGWIFIIFLLVFTILMYQMAQYWMIVPAILLFFTAFFFRNPNRIPPEDYGVIVAPADGKVLRIEDVFEDRFINSDVVKVSIFLSLFNVHINRVPLEGTIDYMERTGIKYLPAYKDQAPDLNVRNFLGLTTQWGKIMVVQITGLVARRIVCWANLGDEVKTGDRFGLIRFGSCTEIYLPKDVALQIKPGDKVKGGETIIGRFIH